MRTGSLWMGWWEQGRAGGQPWLPARGDEIPFGVSLGNPGTGKHHLCNSLNSNSWLHSESRVWDTRSRCLEETLAGRLPWRALRGSAWPWDTVTGAHWSWDAVTTVTISPGDVLRPSIPGTFLCPQCPSFPGSARPRAEAFWEPEDSRGDLIPRVFSWLPLPAPTPRR